MKWLKDRFKYIKYTWNHKKAFLKTEKRLRGFNTRRGYWHDVDKLFLYVFCLWIDKQSIQQIHRKYSRHHVNNDIIKNREDYIEMIIDWECARESKADKPLNAFETMKKFYPELEKELEPIMREFSLIV